MHLAPYLAEAKDSLDSKLEETQKQNTQLAERIRRQKQEIRHLLEGLEAVVGDVEGAVKAMEEADSGGILRREAEFMEEEIKATQQD